MKSGKWLWGGIGLQLCVGFTVGYLVYTIGTLIVDASALNVVSAFCGGLAVVVMAIIVVALCVHSNNKLKAEYALSDNKKQAVSSGK